MLKKINDMIKKRNIEDAYELLVNNRKNLHKKSTYWSLKGDILTLIGEYDLALDSYKQSHLLYSSNINTIKNIIDLCDFIDDIETKNEYINLFLELKEIFSKENVVKLISNDFDKVKQEYIIKCFSFKDIEWYYLKDKSLLNYNEVMCIDDYIIKESKRKIIILPYDINYVENVEYLAANNIDECFIAITAGDKIEFIKIDQEIMNHIRSGKSKNTITMSKLNAGDSNIHALYTYIPEDLKSKFKVNLIKGRDAYKTENIVKIPLLSKIAISGHGTFLTYPYPQLLYNIEVGHGAMPFKTCGVMEKTRKDFAFRPSDYINVNKVCATSTMDMILQGSFSWIPENKFMITGIPRTDTLIKSNGRKNLEKLLKINVSNKKIIFNMPTFHTHYGSGKIDGSHELNDFIKINSFNYDKFDKFLKDNNIIFVTKVHHGEQEIINNKSNVEGFKNMHFISNIDLDREELDLYEILNCADLLITDYSSIYSDFLFMNKPTVFINTDIDEYRKNRGLALEPYDFWTAGPKVNNQVDLHREVLKSILDDSYYKEKRDELRKVYHSYLDDKSCERVWRFIEDVVEGRAE